MPRSVERIDTVSVLSWSVIKSSSASHCQCDRRTAHTGSRNHRSVSQRFPEHIGINEPTSIHHLAIWRLDAKLTNRLYLLPFDPQ